MGRERRQTIRNSDNVLLVDQGIPQQNGSRRRENGLRESITGNGRGGPRCGSPGEVSFIWDVAQCEVYPSVCLPLERIARAIHWPPEFPALHPHLRLPALFRPVNKISQLNSMLASMRISQESEQQQPQEFEQQQPTPENIIFDTIAQPSRRTNQCLYSFSYTT